VGRLPSGADVGGFVIGDLLGEGGFGTVYRARSPQGEPVALKIFKRDPARSHQQSLEQNEIEALLRLNHPSLVRLKSYGYLKDGPLWLVMELVEGEPLNLYLRRQGRLDTIEAIRIVRKIAEALAHCHDLNIAHLDLKPQNIILMDPEEPRLKVLDFGLAYVEGGWKGPDSVRAGTIAYMAPESLQQQRPPTFNPRIDLYALGIIFYELLAGRLPFPADDVSEMIERKRAGDIVPLREIAPDVPEPVQRVVRQLLATDPTERPGSATWLVSCLQDLYFVTLGGGEPVLASAPPTVVTPESVPLLGRQVEMDRLQSALQLAGRGEGHAILVVGEAGLGKSRLVSEFLDDEKVSSGALIGYGRCRELQGLAAYSSLRDGLGQLARRVLDATRSSRDPLRQAMATGIADDAGLLRGLIPELGAVAPEPVAPDQEAIGLTTAVQVGRAIRRLLAAIGRSRPVILVLEDLDHGDEGTLSVLSHLLQEGVPQGVFLLWTSRSDHLELVSATLERIALAPFDRATNRQHLGHLLPGATAKILARLETSIPILSAGNPLFNTQVLRNLEKEGYLARTGAGTLVLAAEAASDYTPPESVSVALQRTLARLSPEVLEILGVAALFGHQFSLAGVIELGIFPADRVQHAVAEAARHYLCSGSGDTYVFVHEAIREHLETIAEPGRLPELHARIAQQARQVGDSAAVLAYHLERAGNLVEASRSHLAAGLEYDGLHDPAGSCRHFRHALDLLSRVSPSEERDGLLIQTAYELSRVGCLAGDTTETLAGLTRCETLLNTTNPAVTIPLKAAFARVFYAKGEFQNAVIQSRDCLALIEKHPESSAYACVPTNILGRVLIASGRPTAARALLTKGCDMARRAGEHVELAHSEGVLSVALAHLGQYDQAQQYVASCASLAERLGDPLRMAGAYFYQSVLAETQFDWKMGVKHTTRLLSYAHEHGIGGLYLLMGTIYAGRHQFHVGRLHRARVLLLNALNLSRVVGISMGVGWTHAFLGDVLFVADRLDDARDWYQKGLDVGNLGSGDDYAGGVSLIGLAQCAAVSGQADDARKWGTAGIERLRNAGLFATLAHAFQRYAEAMESIDDRAAAATARAHSQAQFAQLGVAPLPWRPQVLEEPAWNSKTSDAPTSRNLDLTNTDALQETRLLDTLSSVDGFVPGFAHQGRRE
jgi:tetratricopeptide (TPR) repeat protein